MGQKFNFKSEDASEPTQMLHAFNGATEAIKKCESGLHLWKFVETPAWKKLVFNCDTIDSIFGKCLKTAQDNLKTKNQNNALVPNDIPLLETMLLQDDMAPQDILTVFLDMLLIGVNAVSFLIVIYITFIKFFLNRSLIALAFCSIIWQDALGFKEYLAMKSEPLKITQCKIYQK